MKATCPKCSIVYKVADEKIPAGGAQIKCPKCATVFVVNREAPSVPPAPPPVCPAPAPALKPPTPAALKLPPPPPLPMVSAPPKPVGSTPPQPGTSPPEDRGLQSSPPRAAANLPPPKPAVTAPPKPVVTASLPPPQDPASSGPHTQATPIDDLTALFGDLASEIPDLPPAPGPAGAAAPPPPAFQPPAPQPAAPESAPIDPELAPNMAALTGEAVVQALRDEVRASDGVREQARGRSAIRAQTGSPKADFLESFKVRTARGLTYDFPNAAALERWLAYRDDVAGCEVSLPGQDFVPAITFLEAAKARATAAPPAAPAPVEVQPSEPLKGIGERAPLPRVQRRELSQAPLRAQAGPAAWSFLALSTLALLAGLAATTTRYGWLDLSGVLPLEQLGIVPPERLTPRPVADSGLPGLPPPADPDKAHGQALQAAREAMAQKRFSRAAMEFNRALAVRPGSPEALDGLARAYQALGDAERARSVQKKAQDITHR
ncbi:MAG TPA: zinc-ribbon domain-containing protein [Myxococcota bacterium]|nr:zinc-ribbon domain-containing protein [Myxococcota bacterium]HRY93157.1 zinc-ribbon domain-containing protein [Myxococcota bacterium]HSA21920.1 zinc-ribbon domain-containing protein [Myxococcota bacterium]